MKFLTVKEIVKRLNMTPAMVYHRIQARRVVFYKIGNQLRIPEEEFYKFLKKDNNSLF